MQTIKSFEGALYDLNASSFEDIAMEFFRFQAGNNPVYKQYLTHLGVAISTIKHTLQIPCLPISFFKTQTVRTGDWTPEDTFLSSGTTSDQVSRHDVADKRFYLHNTLATFQNFYGHPSQYHLLALLPSYLERKGSSLVDMITFLMKESQSPWSGFYLNQWDALKDRIQTINRGSNERKIMLWGVSYALLDLAERNSMDLGACIIMETGGMKGRRREITREELHRALKDSFSVPEVHSEYGMTELFSQAYSQGKGYFKCPPCMKVVVRDINDPFSVVEEGKTGTINIVDLANYHTCSFIETQDLGRLHQDGSFEVLGRADNSDRRGCNLLVE